MTPAPARASERILALDVLRGFALLGILTMNITLGLPGAARLIPTIAGGFEGLNFAVWLAGFLLFDEKMITIFSMLFGAGIGLAAARPGARSSFYFRRQWILMFIGLAHAYLLWEGDILFSYAICGMAVYALRNKPVRSLLLWAAGLWLCAVILSRPFVYFLEQARASGDAMWTGMHPSPDAVAKMIATNLNSSYWQIVRARIPEAISFQVMIFPLAFFWTISARMLIGMALYKTGILTGTRGAAFYLRMAALCYLAGYPFVALAAAGLLRNHFDPIFLFGTGLFVNAFGSIFVAQGHMAILLWLLKSGRLGVLARAMAAVGRCALSNYLLQSVIATTLFYGYGFGLFGKLDRTQLAMVVAAIWLVQLLASSLWLRRFQYGPAEWLWRSLTYGKVQPMS